MADRVFINRILAYSARKNSANGPPAYSTLNPDTSSDSPSVRSKGARFVSASVEMYHMAASGQAGSKSQIVSWVVLNICSVKPPVKIMVDSRIRPRLTSYEIVWATARRAPMRAYLELDAHPDPRIEYTARLDRDRIKSIPRFRSVRECGSGIGAHRDRASVRASIGVTKNRNGEEVEGRIGSLINSFTPSAMGCSRPYGPTTFGPLRNCIYPSTFRSMRVRKATASSTGTM